MQACIQLLFRSRLSVGIALTRDRRCQAALINGQGVNCMGLQNKHTQNKRWHAKPIRKPEKQQTLVYVCCVQIVYRLQT